MKKLNQKIAMLASCVLLAGSVTSPGISAEERLVLFRADGGETMLTIEDISSTIVKNEWKDGLETFIKGEHGEAYYSISTRQGSYVVTTADGFPEDSPYFQQAEEISPETLDYSENYENWFSAYPEGSRLYYIGQNKADVCKKLCLDDDAVIDAVYFWKDSQTTACWNGTIGFLEAHPNLKSEIIGYFDAEDDEIVYRNLDGEIEEMPMKISDYLQKYLLEYPTAKEPVYSRDPISEEGWQALNAVYDIGKDWYQKYTDWYNALENTADMTPAELEASRKAAGIEGAYEMIEKAYALCENLVASYPEDFKSASPDFFYGFDYSVPEYERPFTYHTASIWDNVGDTDQDGAITVRDAAEMLQYITSVQTGALYQDNEDREYKEAYYDINADKKINAADAALLLQYIAQQGTGGTHDLQEFVKNTLS